MKTLDIRITCDGCFDMANWASEKSEKSMDQLCAQIDFIKYKKLEDENYVHIRDALALFLFLSGMAYINDDKLLEYIYKYGSKGFDYLKHAIDLHYNQEIVYIEQKNEGIKKINKFIENMQKLITPNKLNRTKIHEYLGKIEQYCQKNNHQYDCIKMISNDIEEVTQGNQNWDWFYQKHKDDKRNLELIEYPKEYIEIKNLLQDIIEKNKNN